MKEKNYGISISVFSFSYKHDYVFFNTLISRYLNLCISMWYLNFFNTVNGDAFVNRSIRLSHDQIYLTLISLLSWSSRI